MFNVHARTLELLEIVSQLTKECSAGSSDILPGGACGVRPKQGSRFKTFVKILEGWLLNVDRLVGLVVRRPPRERKIPGSNLACAGIFSGSSHTSDLKIGTPVATLPGAWRYRVRTGTGRPGVSIL